MSFFIITLRETLEAAIIIGVIFSMLKAFGIEKKRKTIIAVGILAGIIGSFVVAYIFHLFSSGFEGNVEKIYEGILMFLAFIMITQFLVWTNKNFKNIGSSVKNTVKKAIVKKELWMLSFLVFISVLREGVETVIFLNALNFENNFSSFVYAISGIIIAILIAYLVFFTIKSINIKKIISITNIFFLLIASGLLAHSIVEFQGAGIIPTYIKPIFDFSSILSEKEGIGSFLKALFGYDANPSLLAFMGYFIFLLSMGYYLLRDIRKK